MTSNADPVESGWPGPGGRPRPGAALTLELKWGLGSRAARIPCDPAVTALCFHERRGAAASSRGANLKLARQHRHRRASRAAAVARCAHRVHVWQWQPALPVSPRSSSLVPNLRLGSSMLTESARCCPLTNAPLPVSRSLAASRDKGGSLRASSPMGHRSLADGVVGSTSAGTGAAATARRSLCGGLCGRSLGRKLASPRAENATGKVTKTKTTIKQGT